MNHAVACCNDLCNCERNIICHSEELLCNDVRISRKGHLIPRGPRGVLDGSVNHKSATIKNREFDAFTPHKYKYLAGTPWGFLGGF